MKEVKTIYDAQYRCRACGVEFIIEHSDRTTGYSSFGVDHGRWYATTDAIQRNNEFWKERTGRYCEGNPELHVAHWDCPGGVIGLADLIGLANPRQITKRERGWVVVKGEE